jgi:hypothetical protein
MSYRDFTFEQISTRFVYEPKTGRLVRKLPDGSVRELRVARERPGGEGYMMTNYIGFAGYTISATNIIFMLMMKRWVRPGYLIDHRNGNHLDCRWSNLREGTPEQNNWNADSSGLRWIGGDGLERGVSLHRDRKYRVRISVNGEQRDFGRYDTKEEANEVARKVIMEVQGEWRYAVSRAPRPWRRI